jgi:hypothetical protein
MRGPTLRPRAPVDSAIIPRPGWVDTVDAYISLKICLSLLLLLASAMSVVVDSEASVKILERVTDRLKKVHF